MFACERCGCRLQTKNGLSKHYRRNSCPRAQALRASRACFECPACGAGLASNGALHNHKKRLHPELMLHAVERGRIACLDCEETLVSTAALCEHVQMAHGVPAALRHRRFADMSAFREWLEQLKVERLTEFVQHSQKRKVGEQLKTYYCCSRSGKYDSRATGYLRAPPAKGTKKCGHTCTAFAAVKHNLLTGIVDVKYCLDHYKHSMDLKHLRMPSSLRNEIAETLVDDAEDEPSFVIGADDFSQPFDDDEESMDGDELEGEEDDDDEETRRAAADAWRDAVAVRLQRCLEIVQTADCDSADAWATVDACSARFAAQLDEVLDADAKPIPPPPVRRINRLPPSIAGASPAVNTATC